MSAEDCYYMQCFLTDDFGILVRRKLRDIAFRFIRHKRNKDRWDIYLLINGKHAETFGYMTLPGGGSEEFGVLASMLLAVGYKQAVQDFNLEPLDGPWVGHYQRKNLESPASSGKFSRIQMINAKKPE